MKILNKFILLILIILIILLLTVLESILSSYKRYRRTKEYYNRIKNKNKRLLVIGDPCTNSKLLKLFERLFGKMYEHGDITLDLYGCEKCVKKDINDIEYLKSLDNYIVFETGTLSFSKDIKSVLNELKRISGDDLFISGGTTGVFWRYIGKYIYSKMNKYNNINYEVRREKNNIIIKEYFGI